MRIVRDVDALEGAIEQARSFGDHRLYVERYIENPRHIEVQVLGDSFGNIVHLFERECSVQRRFQKIIEEAPSPALSPELRKRVCETAVGIARAANYQNAGTVEFIFDAGEFYSLEMNTRLQVEHPVTEMITGIDLVAEQVYATAGRELGFAQSDIVSNGHAIEVRLYAEAPEPGYVPTSGKVLLLEYPSGVRIDSGITQGQPITTRLIPCSQRSSRIRRRAHWPPPRPITRFRGSFFSAARQTLASSPASLPTSRLSADSFIRDIWRKTRTLPVVTLLPAYRHSWHQLLS